MSNNTYRVGELVWYEYGKVYRLGIIACNIGRCLLWPLAYTSTVEIPLERLRPFRRYSVPPVDHPDLKGKTFNEIDWDTVYQACNDDRLAVEASKLAAMRINQSVSLVGDTLHIRGCYLGAERIEIGDALRLKSDRNSIIRLSAILVTNSSLIVRGNIYKPGSNEPWTLAKEEAEVFHDQLCGRLYDEFPALDDWYGHAKLRETRWETLGKSVMQDESKAILDRIEPCEDEYFRHGNETPCTQFSQPEEAGKITEEVIEHVSASDPLEHITEAVTPRQSTRDVSLEPVNKINKNARIAKPRRRRSPVPATRSSFRLEIQQALRRSLLEGVNSS